MTRLVVTRPPLLKVTKSDYWTAWLENLKEKEIYVGRRGVEGATWASSRLERGLRTWVVGSADATSKRYSRPIPHFYTFTRSRGVTIPSVRYVLKANTHLSAQLLSHRIVSYNRTAYHLSSRNVYILLKC